jgi:hypothetical protein
LPSDRIMDRLGSNNGCLIRKLLGQRVGSSSLENRTPEKCTHTKGKPERAEPPSLRLDPNTWNRHAEWVTLVARAPNASEPGCMPGRENEITLIIWRGDSMRPQGVFHFKVDTKRSA